MTSPLFLIPFYLAGAFLAWGFTLGSFSTKFPYMKHTSLAAVAAICGPIGLPGLFLMLFLVGGKVGWRLKPIPFEERYHEFQNRYSILGQDRAYFEANYR